MKKMPRRPFKNKAYTHPIIKLAIEHIICFLIILYTHTTVKDKGPIVTCPEDAFGLTEINADTPVQWDEYITAEGEDGTKYDPTCTHDDADTTVIEGFNFFKVGTTTVTCTAWDAAGNPGHCTFLVTVTGL